MALRSDRLIRTLLISAIFLLGIYTLFIWTDSSVGISVKPFGLEFDFDYRYAYADEDEAVGSLLHPAEDTDSTGSNHALKPRSASERLIASGVGFCENWTVPADEEEVERREKESSCWKDGHYRQLKSFLDKAETDKSYSELSWHNELNKRNMKSLRSVFACLPYFGSQETLPEECHDNMLNVMVFQDWWWDMAVVGGSESGETVWLRTMVETFVEENYTFVNLNHHQYQNLVIVHNALPDIVTFIYARDTLALSCLSDPRCRSDFPPNTTAVTEIPMGQRGTIPSWKLFTVDYWGARPGDHGRSNFAYGIQPGEEMTFNPLGNEWTVAPFPYPGHTYIPLTLEKSCLQLGVVPHHRRKGEVTVLGKLYQYFYPHRMGLVPQDVWPPFQNATSLAPIANARALKETDVEQSTPPGLINKGPVPSANYTQQVANSKVLLTIGRPEISPSPYLALQVSPCRAAEESRRIADTPLNAGVWAFLSSCRISVIRLCQRVGIFTTLQHGPAAAIGPPYVYSYHMGDNEDMYAAVRAARDNPIERYIPDDMRHAHVRSEIMKLITTDWGARSREIEAERVDRGEPAQSLVKQHITERLFHLGVGRRMGADGELLETLANEK
ncbi:hypothetical protein QFC21_002620 [Naganishia friedmannii]|uniref:Uncharacterized protein n=1 Tax=Naganishia friedmannii TaxID=89922 RepID=A0ACC2VWG1_9TREE|nr:hypothetical protein QFC21_002620 [Naganishia friedmannii]